MSPSSFLSCSGLSDSSREEIQIRQKKCTYWLPQRMEMSVVVLRTFGWVFWGQEQQDCNFLGSFESWMMEVLQESISVITKLSCNHYFLNTPLFQGCLVILHRPSNPIFPLRSGDFTFFLNLRVSSTVDNNLPTRRNHG